MLNTDIQNIKNDLSNLKATLDEKLTVKGAVAGATLNQSIDNINTISTGGGGVDFTQIGYSETPKYIQDAIDYGVQIKNDWDATHTSLLNRFQNNIKLVYMPLVDTSKATNMYGCFDGCANLEYVPALDTSKVEDMRRCFSGCENLKFISKLDTSKVRIIQSFFYTCKKIQMIEELSFKSATNIHEFFNAWYNSGHESLRYCLIKDLGTKTEATKLVCSGLPVWGENTEDEPNARQSLVDTLITYSFDRATAGFPTFTITLTNSTNGRLTEAERAEITAKGYTIIIEQ